MKPSEINNFLISESAQESHRSSQSTGSASSGTGPSNTGPSGTQGSGQAPPESREDSPPYPVRDPRDQPQDTKAWNYSGLDLMSSGAAFWQNYSGKFYFLILIFKSSPSPSL